MSSSRLNDAASAANRFGLGARPDTLEGLTDPRAALVQELRTPAKVGAAFAGLPSSADYLAEEVAFRADRKARKRDLERANAAGQDGAANSKPGKPPGGGFRREFGDKLLAEGRARWQLALRTPLGFEERLVAFWSNHFAVSIDKRQALLYAAPMEREAIRPHVFGRFQDLLIAVESHPAMLRYLDNVASIGPDSRLGARVAQAGGNAPRRRKFGLNENLGREILELHTLGVNGGYTQADVIELAKAITGWSLRRPAGADMQRPYAQRLQAALDGGVSDASAVTAFVFRPNTHEPGARTILGRRYAEGGMQQGRRVLADLAMHPATAHHLATKLARHFVQDQPPAALVERMARRYLDHGGDLPALYLALLDSDEAWSPQARKFRTPRDFMIAGMRAVGATEVAEVGRFAGLLAKMGQPEFMPRSPAGFADTADAWIGPDALWKRIQVAEEFGRRAPASLDVTRLASAALGPRLRRATTQAIARADSPREALGVLLASPDFQWRI